MKHNTILKQTLTPSWVVNFIGLAVGVLMTAGGIILSRYQGSQLQQEVFETQTNAAVNNGTYHAISANLANNSLLGSLPLLLTWAAIGLVIYFFATSIHQTFSEAASLRDQLQYVHSSRQFLLWQALTNLVVRAVAVIVWFIVIKLTIDVFIPYALASASLAARSLSLMNVLYAVLSVAVMYMTVYLHAVLLRLIVLRPRVFNT